MNQASEGPEAKITLSLKESTAEKNKKASDKMMGRAIWDLSFPKASDGI